jgi:hypothetical protein
LSPAISPPGRGLRKSLLILCAGFNIPFAVYLVLALTQPTNLPLITAMVSLEYLGYGFGFIGLQLFMMQQIAPGPYRTAHYAFATSVMNLGFLIPSAVSGFLERQARLPRIFHLGDDRHHPLLHRFLAGALPQHGCHRNRSQMI